MTLGKHWLVKLWWCWYICSVSINFEDRGRNIMKEEGLSIQDGPIFRTEENIDLSDWCLSSHRNGPRENTADWYLPTNDPKYVFTYLKIFFRFCTHCRKPTQMQPKLCRNILREVSVVRFEKFWRQLCFDSVNTPHPWLRLKLTQSCEIRWIWGVLLETDPDRMVKEIFGSAPPSIFQIYTQLPLKLTHTQDSEI